LPISVHTIINFPLNLDWVDLKVVPGKEDVIPYYLQFSLSFFANPSVFFFKNQL
jgi:hypothetical protein